MKQSFVLASIAASALATPLVEKRWEYTTWDVETVTVTVTGEAPVATQENKWFGGNSPWGGQWSQSSAAPAATTTEAATSAAAIPTWSAAPAPASSAAWSAPAAPASSAAWSAAPSAAPSAVPVSGDYQTAVLAAHNNHRTNCSVPALEWDDNMASIAQTIAASCNYAHNTAAGGGGYGQNIGAGADDSGVPAMINNEMYNGEINYYPGYGSEPDMSNFEKWGHYSQIVWKSTTGVGCYTQYCPGGLANTGGGVSPYFTVCNYSPAGNFGGEYGANVLQPGNMATVNL